MLYLQRLHLPTQNDEDSFRFRFPFELEQCFDETNAYPFGIFPEKGLSTLEFEPITIFYGGNGSGKSTLLRVIAEKLALHYTSRFHRTPCFTPYLDGCRVALAPRVRGIPSNSRIITSDDVFDYLLDIRALNKGIGLRREELFKEYYADRDPSAPPFLLQSLDDYEELKRRNESRHSTISAYTARRLPKELRGKSNGESAYLYFTEQITEKALFLLDEPENSLSPVLQEKLCTFLEESVRFYDCQLILSTHSPFLLGMRHAKIYDLDASPVVVRPWAELPNVRLYHDFFERHRAEFS